MAPETNRERRQAFDPRDRNPDQAHDRPPGPCALLARFADAVRAHDSAGLAMRFTADGRYDDGFFGVHVARA